MRPSRRAAQRSTEPASSLRSSPMFSPAPGLRSGPMFSPAPSPVRSIPDMARSFARVVMWPRMCPRARPSCRTQDERGIHLCADRDYDTSTKGMSAMKRYPVMDGRRLPPRGWSCLCAAHLDEESRGFLMGDASRRGPTRRRGANTRRHESSAKTALYGPFGQTCV